MHALLKTLKRTRKDEADVDESSHEFLCWTDEEELFDDDTGHSSSSDEAPLAE